MEKRWLGRSGPTYDVTTKYDNITKYDVTTEHDVITAYDVIITNYVNTTYDVITNYVITINNIITSYEVTAWTSTTIISNRIQVSNVWVAIIWSRAELRKPSQYKTCQIHLIWCTYNVEYTVKIYNISRLTSIITDPPGLTTGSDKTYRPQYWLI